MRLLFLLLIPLTGVKAQVLINEIGIAPAAGQPEFVELFNNNNCPVDLSCYTLVFSSTSGSGNATGWTLKIPQGNQVGACSYFLIGGTAGAAGVTAGTGYPTGGAMVADPSAHINLGTAAITSNAVYIKRGLAAGAYSNSSGQLSLFDASGHLIASVAYNNGNNPTSYPMSAYTSCLAFGNSQGQNNIADPGPASHQVNGVFSASANKGIALNASGNYVTTGTLTPGSPNASQLACAITPLPVGSGTACIMEGQVFDFNGQSLTGTGLYSALIPRPNQCDSIARLYLTVTKETDTIINHCGPYLFQGTVYHSSQTIHDTVPSAVTGCDSLRRTMHLLIHQPADTFIQVCLAPGQQYVFGGQVLQESGQYISVLQTSKGCDSTVNLELTITKSDTVYHAGCEKLVYGGTSYTASTVLNETILSTLTGCDSIHRTVQITVHPKPWLHISGNTSICETDTATLLAVSNGSVFWSGFGNANPITVSPALTTSYNAIASNAAGCTDTASVMVQVSAFDLQIQASQNPVIAGAQLQLSTSANQPYQVLSWSLPFPDPHAKQQNLVIDSTITVRLTGRSFQHCIDSASLTIIADPIGGFYLPSAFSPNNDGLNDRFTVYGGAFSSVSLSIFNRWGQEVFSVKGRSGWDGNCNGKPQPAGVYVYILSARLKNGSSITKKGTLLLIR